jgi:putative chitinase
MIAQVRLREAPLGGKAAFYDMFDAAAPPKWGERKQSSYAMLAISVAPDAGGFNAIVAGASMQSSATAPSHDDESRCSEKQEDSVITAETLRKFAPQIKDAEVHAPALEDARSSSSVTMPRRLCHFLGQIFVETRGFTSMTESLNYKDPARLDGIFSAGKGVEDAGQEAIANRVYASRLGNGDEASGDGWRYRGSGYKQLTGRGNYREIGAIVGLDLENNPEIAREPTSAARIAVAFWDARGCSPLADLGDVEGVTEKINGPAKLGLAERREATLRARDIWTS